jgi:sugar phosphate isomerase/epimerase
MAVCETVEGTAAPDAGGQATPSAGPVAARTPSRGKELVIMRLKTALVPALLALSCPLAASAGGPRARDAGSDLPAHAAATVTSDTARDYPFFPFCIDWHDARKRDFTQQASMLKELGYSGVGHIWLDKVAERLESLDAAGLKLYQITMPVDLTPGKPPYDPRFKDVLAMVKGRHVQFDLLVSGYKPSDPAGDARAVVVFREMSDLARDSGSELLLYPHVSNWIERIEDAVRVADAVDRRNVGVMFNLCHWLRVDPKRDYAALLKRAAPRLRAISLNGADAYDPDAKAGWAHYIQPLDKGSFDIAAFLKTLKDVGYKGPIGLQCFGIGGDAREHLERSLAAWRKLSKALDD